MSMKYIYHTSNNYHIPDEMCQLLPPLAQYLQQKANAVNCSTVRSTPKHPPTLAVLQVCVVCECENDRGVLLVLLVVDETGEVTAMARELGKHELVAFVTRQRVHKL